MSCSVKTTWGGGVDLSRLTSGELVLIGLLYTSICTISALVRFGYDHTAGSTIPDSARYLDLSAISSIEVRKLNNLVTTISVSYFDNGEVVSLPSTAVSTTSLSYDVSSVPKGVFAELRINGNSSGSLVPEVEWLSFTTRDGKVHTKSNLNY